MQPFIVMTESGFFRLRPEFLGPKLREIGDFIQRSPASIPNVSSVTVYGMQVGINLVAQNNHTIAYSRLPYIRFFCEFVNVVNTEDARLSFSYPRIPQRGDSNSGRPMRDVRWLVPAPFALVAASSTADENLRIALVNTTTSRIWRLPLPNLYDDGRVCLGERPHSTNVIERHANNVNAFYSNAWNQDLFSGKEVSFKHLFQWSLNEDQQIASDSADSIITVADREGVPTEHQNSSEVIVSTVERYCVPLGNPMFDFVEHFI